MGGAMGATEGVAIGGALGAAGALGAFIAGEAIGGPYPVGAPGGYDGANTCC